MAPAFFLIMTEEDRADLERPQKILVKILTGSDYTNYSEELNRLGVVTIRERMIALCFSWAIKAASDKKFFYLFPKFPLVEYRLSPSKCGLREAFNKQLFY